MAGSHKSTVHGQQPTTAYCSAAGCMFDMLYSKEAPSAAAVQPLVPFELALLIDCFMPKHSLGSGGVGPPPFPVATAVSAAATGGTADPRVIDCCHKSTEKN